MILYVLSILAAGSDLWFGEYSPQLVFATLFQFLLLIATLIVFLYKRMKLWEYVGRYGALFRIVSTVSFMLFCGSAKMIIGHFF